MNTLHNRNRNRSIAAQLIAAVLLAIHPAKASLLLHDDFGGYDAASQANGQAYGGTGFAAEGTWICDNCNANAATFESGDLVFTKDSKTLASSGDRHFRVSEANGGWQAHLETPITEGVIYFSVVAQATDIGTDFAGVSINTNATANFILDEDDLPNGKDDTDVHLFVFKFDFENDAYTSWVDPVPGSIEGSNTPFETAAIEVPGLALNNIYMRVGGPQGTNVPWLFDELRLGESFEDVTPSTEPPLPFLITNFELTVDGPAFTFNSTAGSSYLIYRSTDLTADGLPGGWLELVDSYPPDGATGTSTVFTDLNFDTDFPEGAVRVFYRAKEQ